MSEPQIVVLDASVGAKWLKPEAGHEQAKALLQDHHDGRKRIVVASHFAHEFIVVAIRHGGVNLGRQAWEYLQAAHLVTIGLDHTLARAAFAQVDDLGCSFYDAVAPALACELGADLYSADVRAHSRFPRVCLIPGESQ